VAKRVIYLHTVMRVAPQFDELSRTLLPPDTEWWHIVDEMLAKVALAQGGLSPFLYRRVADHALAAQQAGADVLQLTCSSISPCVDAIQCLADMPILKIDAPMVEQALGMATRIGVAATARTALAPLTDLLCAQARAAGKHIEVDPVLCEGAYAGLVSGDLASHDRIVRTTLIDMIRRNDVIVLAQASMARVVETMPPSAREVPILTSPRLAVEHLRAVLVGQ
jgi:Asp/Glu/hydantoin racemase